MNREQAKQLLPIIQAFADGETLQFRFMTDSQWADIEDASFSSVHMYRIKPKPLEWWALVDRDNQGTIYSDESRANDEHAWSAKNGSYAPYRVVHMVEITE